MKPFEPVHIAANLAEEEEVEPERVPFFFIGDEEFTILKEVPPRLTAIFLNDIRQGGEAYAVSRALVSLIGEDSMDALAESTEVGEEEMGRIMSIASELLMGAMNKSLGKSRSARRKSGGSRTT